MEEDDAYWLVPAAVVTLAATFPCLYTSSQLAEPRTRKETKRRKNCPCQSAVGCERGGVLVAAFHATVIERGWETGCRSQLKVVCDIRVKSVRRGRLEGS